MARKPGSSPQAMKARAAKTAAAIAPASALAASAPASKKKTSPGQFLREVRAEGRKITWTTRKETWITSVMVGIMVVMAATFFFVVDLGLGAGVNLLLTYANRG